MDEWNISLLAASYIAAKLGYMLILALVNMNGTLNVVWC